MSEKEKKRVVVLIDGNALYHMQRNAEFWIDYRPFRSVLVADHDVVDVRYHATAHEKADSFYTFLRTIGYTVVLTEDKDVDDRLNEDIAELCSQANVMVVVLGDNDHIDALGLAKHKGCELVVYCVEEMLSANVRNIADHVVDIREIRDQIIDETKTSTKPFYRPRADENGRLRD